MADSSASIWDVTRLILDDPGADPAEIAEAHGFSAADVAELLPMFLDNVRVDLTQAGSPGTQLPAAEPAPGESAEGFLERYLTALGEASGVDVVSYDSLVVPDSGNGSLVFDPPDPAATPVFGAGRPENASVSDPDPQPASDGQVGPPSSDDPVHEAVEDAVEDPFDFATGTLGDGDAPGKDDVSDFSDTDFQFD